MCALRMPVQTLDVVLALLSHVLSVRSEALETMPLSYLEQIVYVPHARKPYQCRICGETFSEGNSAKRHVESPPERCRRLARMYGKVGHKELGH
jgi:hypothetical protein